MILWRPVYQRASLIAFSFASAPPFVKNDIFRLPGVTSASRRASSERGSVAIGGPLVARFAPRSRVAAATLRGGGPLFSFAGRDAEAGEGWAASGGEKGPPAGGSGS